MTPQQKHMFLTSKQMKADEEDKEKKQNSADRIYEQAANQLGFFG